jgi:zinc/manganese transport system ATP-binding protein
MLNRVDPVATASAVTLDGVTLAFGTRAVLRDVSLAIPDGAFVGVLGANGAGKTTLMRALLGLVPAGTGTIRVLGQPVRRGGGAIGYMPQTRSPAGRLVDGWSFVASAAGGQRWGLPVLGAADRAEVHWALDLVDATALARRPIAELSGGERQRLLLAQALLGRPRLLLLDEPLASLDPRHQGAVVSLVSRLQRELGLTVLFSAHDLNPLLGAMDQVLYLAGGGAALGSVAEVITAPVLSRLYGSPIEVAHVNGRIFVLSGGHLADGHCASAGGAAGHAHV